MKTKFFTLIFFLVLLQSCNNEFTKEVTEPVDYITDDITTLVVPDGHDLRPIAIQNTNIILSETSRADVVRVKVFEVEDGNQKLLYSGVIDRETSISNVVKVPNHISLLSVQADLAIGTREWILTPSELQNLVIEDEIVPDVDADENKSATSGKSSSKISSKASAFGAGVEPPTWDCGDFDEFTGNDNGNFKITNSSTQGINIDKKTTIYICSGGSWNPSFLNDSGGKLEIYVGEGASLTLSGTINSTIYNVGTFNGVNLNISKDAAFDNWGTTNIVGNLSADSKDINIYNGTCNVSGSTNLTDNAHLDVDGGRLAIGGHVTNSGTFHNKVNSETVVAGNFTINGNGSFSNECKTTISGNFINNKKVDFENASYTVIAGSFINNSDSEVTIKEGSVFKSASIHSNAKIKGSKGYSVIETGAITFVGNSSGFEGELDICSDSFTESMRNNKVINTCDTFISPSTCSLGYNDGVDEDNDGVIAGVDVDDNNPNVASYNFPQGEGSFYTSLYEDLYPCMGDYDLNDFVHNYSYQEGILNGVINEIKFDYKFPAIGAGFNNSFVLRVMDTGDTAALILDAASAYDSAEITRVHDTENNTTLFVFNNIKSIYTSNTGAIINTVRIDYANIPVISGTVTNINGAYDEFILQNGEMGHEIHPLYNELHRDFAALNSPSMYNDANNFSRCDDKSSGTNLFVNNNGFPWVLTDLPVDLPWPKEGISILEAFPNFDDFVTSNPALDWYTNINGNRNSANLIE